MSAMRLSSQRMVMSPEAFFERCVAEDLETNLIPHRFEEVCRQYLVRQNRAGRMPETPLEIGKYWCDCPATHESGEFDIVTRDARGCVFYEAKFRSTPVTAKMMAEEIARVRRTGIAAHAYGFFSRSGFEGSPPEGARPSWRAPRAGSPRPRPCRVGSSRPLSRMRRRCGRACGRQHVLAQAHRLW